MAIALVSSTTGATGVNRTDTTITAPASISNGNILLGGVVTSHTGDVTPTPSPPSGFTRIGTELVYNEGGFQTKLGVWWKRASGESGNYTWTHTGADCQGWMGNYSGCLASGTPVGTPTQNSGTGATTTGLAVTIGSAGSWLVYCATDFNWGAGLSPPTGMTERNDSNFYLSDELRSSTGSTGNRTQTNSNGAGDEWLAYMFELIIAASAATSKPLRRNTIVPWRRPF